VASHGEAPLAVKQLCARYRHGEENIEGGGGIARAAVQVCSRGLRGHLMKQGT
jgi:hypothetical protein